MNIKRFFYYWVPFIIYAFLIFFLSSQPVNMLPHVISSHFDKIAHFVEYAVFGFLLLRALGIDKSKVFNIDVRLFVVIISVVFGISDEFHQAFVPGRDADIADFLFDGIGAFAGQLIIRKNSV